MGDLHANKLSLTQNEFVHAFLTPTSTYTQHCTDSSVNTQDPSQPRLHLLPVALCSSSVFTPTGPPPPPLVISLHWPSLSDPLLWVRIFLSKQIKSPMPGFEANLRALSSSPRTFSCLPTGLLCRLFGVTRVAGSPCHLVDPCERVSLQTGGGCLGDKTKESIKKNVKKSACFYL